MSKYLRSAFCCALLIGNAQAEDHWYGTVSGGASLLDDISVHGLNYNGQALPAVRHHDDFDTGYFAGASIGRTIADHWRVETEFSYRENDLDRVRIRTDGGLGAALGGGPVGGSRVDGKGGVEATNLLANGFYDFNFQQFRPYLGGGIGLAHVKITDARAIDLRSLQALAPVDEAAIGDSSDTVFAYQVGAGIGYPIRPGLTASVDYRFLGAVDPEFHSVAAANNFHSQYRTNNFGMSLRFEF